jgi:hypothetical protein
MALPIKETRYSKQRVDGILLHRDDRRTMAILEVKPFIRVKKEAAIQRQEAAQMAAWISSEGEASTGARVPITRVASIGVCSYLHRHEVYLVFAAFDDEYVRYVTGNAKAKAKVDTFLRMHQFGLFVIAEGHGLVIGESGMERNNVICCCRAGSIYLDSSLNFRATPHQISPKI